MAAIGVITKLGIKLGKTTLALETEDWQCSALHPQYASKVDATEIQSSTFTVSQIVMLSPFSNKLSPSPINAKSALLNSIVSVNPELVQVPLFTADI